MCLSFQCLYSWALDGNCYSWTFICLYTQKYPQGYVMFSCCWAFREFPKDASSLTWSKQRQENSHRRTVTVWLLAWILHAWYSMEAEQEESTAVIMHVSLPCLGAELLSLPFYTARVACCPVAGFCYQQHTSSELITHQSVWLDRGVQK